MADKEHLKDYEYTQAQAKAINEYLRAQPVAIREKIIEIVTDGICIHCGELVDEGSYCHCTNDE